MRLSTKLGASLSAAALGSAVVLGGAGVAQAQSSGSLGSSADQDLVVTLDEADENGANGTLVNNTENDLSCYVGVTDATTASDLEDALAEDDADVEALFTDALADVDGYDYVEVDANDTAAWSLTDFDRDEDYLAAAGAVCGLFGEAPLVAFAYESGGSSGSLDMGSLGS